MRLLDSADVPCQHVGMEKKYQIFISSTFSDLVEERQSVSRAILDMGHIPAGMEMFPAADVEQLTYIKKVIDECDYYVLVIGARYGSLDEDGVSYTEREFQYAVETGKTVLAFLPRKPDQIPQGKTDKNDLKRQKLNDFVSMVSKGRLVQYWDNAIELRANAIVSLTKAFSESPQIGWVRADTLSSASTMADIIKFRNENDSLRAEIKKLKENLSPRYLDAADLSAALEIPFSYLYGPGSSASRRKGSRKISFYEFLRWVGPSLHTPSTVAGVCTAAERAIREREGVAGRSLHVPQTPVNDALLHLVATSHVKMWPSRLENGTNVTAFQLTDLGIQIWKELSYVKSNTGKLEEE